MVTNFHEHLNIVISPKRGNCGILVPSVGFETLAKVRGILVADSQKEYKAIGEVNYPLASRLTLYGPVWHSILTKKLQHVHLPSWLEKNLVSFLQFYKENAVPNFDCLAFFLSLQGYPDWYRERGTEVLDGYRFHPIKAPKNARIPIGTGILMEDSSGKSAVLDGDDFHILVGIGEDLYISKLGKDGPIVVMNWKEACKLYPTYTSIFVIHPSDERDITERV